jgi:hypothetical protein
MFCFTFPLLKLIAKEITSRQLYSLFEVLPIKAKVDLRWKALSQHFHIYDLPSYHLEKT